MVSKTWPALYRKLESGKIKIWGIRVERNSNEDLSPALITVRHGFVDGKIQTITETIREGKNVGRANKTTPYQQAYSEANSKWNKHADAGYVEDEQGETAKLLPMLAQDYRDSGHRMKWPAFAQRKLNGIRCLVEKMSETQIRYTSRKNKVFTTLSHLTPHLLPLMKVGEILDGEIYKHGLSLQKIGSLVKKFYPGETDKLEYWLFDIVDKTATNEERFDVLAQFEFRHPLMCVETVEIFNEEDMKKWHDIWVKDGFEGAIIRNKNGKYVFGAKVAQLQKYKDFFDKEVTIVGGKSGRGLDEGCVIFSVKDEFGNIFDSKPNGTREMRRQWFIDLPNLIGKQLTTRYQELSDDNVPVFNRGIAIRDYE